MNGRWRNASGLSSLDIDNFVIDFVIRLIHDHINRRGVVEDYKGEASRVSSDSVTHDFDALDRAELFEVKLKRFFRRLPGKTSHKDLPLVKALLLRRWGAGCSGRAARSVVVRHGGVDLRMNRRKKWGYCWVLLC